MPQSLHRCFSGKFRNLPALTKHIFDQISPIRNNWNGARKGFESEERAGASSVERKKQNRADRRRELVNAQARFDQIKKDRDLEAFFKSAAETIQNQQFRTAVVQVAALIGISIIGGAVAGLAARAVGGILLEAAGAAELGQLSTAARVGITAAKTATQIGVDTTISAAGTAAVQGRDFGEIWKENLIVALGSSALFGTMSRYAAAQAKIEGKIAETWAKAGKLGKLKIAVKEAGVITAHTLWGAAMGAVAGRIVTGKTQPPPETLREWALQGISVAVGRHVQQRMSARSKTYKAMEQWAEDRGRGLAVGAKKLTALANQVISSKKPSKAVDLLAEHDQFLRKEIEAIDRAITKGGDPTGELRAARDNLELAAEAAGSEGMMDTKMALLGMEELVPGALWKGTEEQISTAIKQAQKGKQAVVVSREGKRWRVKVGDREIEIQQVASAAKTVDVERVVLGGGDDELRVAAKLVPPEAGSLDVVVHGTVDDFIVVVNGQDLPLSHRSLAKYIEKAGLRFTRIRLLACKAGMHPKGAAQHLANKLGVPVVAPVHKLYIHPDGKLTVGPSESRDLGAAGWKEYKPQKSESRYQKAPDATSDSAAAQKPTNEPTTGAKRLGPESDEPSAVSQRTEPSSEQAPASSTVKPKPEAEQYRGPWPPPAAGPRPEGAAQAAWRHRRYLHKEHAKGKQRSEVYNEAAYQKRGYDTAADEGKRPGRGGGKAQQAAKAKLAKEEQFDINETTTLGTRPKDGGNSGETQRNDVDGGKRNSKGGIDFTEIDHMGQRGRPTARYRRKLAAEIKALGPNDRIIFIDSTDTSRRIIYTADDIPNADTVVQQRRGPALPRAKPVKRTRPGFKPEADPPAAATNTAEPDE